MSLLESRLPEILLFFLFSGLLVALSVWSKVFRVKKYDITGKRNFFFLLSGVVVALCLVSLLVKGLKLGLDFKGGTLMEMGFYRQVRVEELRDALVSVSPKLSESRIQFQKGIQTNQPEGGKDLLATSAIVRTDFLSQDEISAIYKKLEEKFGKVEQLKNERVGPTMGAELKRNALIALVIALGIQLLYIAGRFGYNIRYGVAADIALVHDVIVMVGLYALFGKEADSPFVAALLTVIGYSVMDSIVIFDRIRENVKILHRETFESLVNTSVLQTMTRSVNTLLTVLFTLFALYFFGGATLKNFAFALLIGVTSGAYSSIFVAAPLLVVWDYWTKKREAQRAREEAAAPPPEASARGRREGPPPSVKGARRKGVAAGVEEPEEEEVLEEDYPEPEGAALGVRVPVRADTLRKRRVRGKRRRKR